MMRRFTFLLLLLTMAACDTSPRAEDPLPPTSKTVSEPTPSATPSAKHAARPAARDLHGAEGVGTWYPGEPEELYLVVQEYVAQATAEPVPGPLLALIVPHAGYLYSGAVAGYAYDALQDAGCEDHTLVIIGDTHTGNGTAQIAVWASGGFQTPLGTIPIDEEVAQALVAADPRIEFDRKAFQAEHPVENQIPFIQALCPGAKIVPIVIRQPSLSNAQSLADALVTVLDQRPTRIIASTDLSHYHAYEEARQMDAIALQAIASLDAQEVADSPQRCAEQGLGGNDPLTMCSQGAVMTALLAARQMGADRVTVLRYASSGDSPLGDRAQVVGYAAVALTQAGNGDDTGTVRLDPSPPVPAEPLPLSDRARKQMLDLARRTADQFLRRQTFPAFQTDDPTLLQPLGAYVTYEQDQELRGCVGRLEGDRPAYLNVQYAAIAAALADTRFPAINPEELEDLTLEITLLHPMRQVMRPEEIQIGRDGVLMRVGEESGALFLPQVPLESGWDVETTLIHLCRKAGLSDDCWQQPNARFYTFAGEWFAEGE